MIAFVHGTLTSLDVQHKKAVIDVQGVGYECFTHDRDNAVFQEKIGNDVFIHTCQVMRQEQWELYGFLSAEEKHVFTDLLSVNGVGAKMAMALLGFAGINELTQAVLTKQVAFFKAVPGVGPKLANRIILELGNKVKKWPSEVVAQQAEGEVHLVALDELRSTLLNLGYNAGEIEPLLLQAHQDKDFTQHPFEEKIRWCLQKLSSRKQLQDSV